MLGKNEDKKGWGKNEGKKRVGKIWKKILFKKRENLKRIRKLKMKKIRKKKKKKENEKVRRIRRAKQQQQKYVSAPADIIEADSCGNSHQFYLSERSEYQRLVANIVYVALVNIDFSLCVFTGIILCLEFIGIVNKSGPILWSCAKLRKDVDNQEE
ncbi:hypothetical protein RFI_34800 [Reticulomyxa filosa]|uniref:Uncharacterized protein n=1 Tax=Reticulomyxa filosa TaxID=46433 RepID=X6LKY7_RETFI|nr:hypothetical protein RFI_34800 [Reticulomyxa filosa]|eukprot:ETO02618.1 hypothetical protein RFI_34800 [Reticulomyxa filosa]